MNSLLEKEGMSGKVQMIYIDPPYGIKYGSNFQPFINKRDVTDGKDEDLSQEPEMIKAFRDTWELGIHSYLSYLRDRLLLARDLLHDSGSIFVQISEKNQSYVRLLMDEIFGESNFITQIPFIKTGAQTGKTLPTVVDYIIWYSKDISKLKANLLFIEKEITPNTLKQYPFIELSSGKRRRLSSEEKEIPNKIPKDARLYQLQPLHSQHYSKTRSIPFEFQGEIYYPPANRQWATSIEGLQGLEKMNRIEKSGNTIRYIRYFDEFVASPLTNVWIDTATFRERVFVVQTNTKVVERCILMTTDPGDLVFDPTCGSGTTAYVAEQWGRRWISCDTSRIAITISKQRLLTSVFDYYELNNPKIGVQSGFIYKKIERFTLGSIAKNESPEIITLLDQPKKNDLIIRVTGPFTVEAVPSPYVKPLTDTKLIGELDTAITREGETLRQSQWRSELLETGIRGKNGQKIELTSVEPLSGTVWLHADAETKEVKPKRAVISFGPEYAPLDQNQVELAISEAQTLVPKPQLIIFSSFQFDPEASKDIDDTKWPRVTLLKVQMNADLLTEDLKKERASNESFWLIGQPDVKLSNLSDDKYQIEIQGFDYYNTITGEIESGGSEKIAMWMADTDYDYRSLFPRQVFFPMAGKKEGWSRLASSLKSEIDEDLIEQYRGTISLPFELGGNKTIAIKIIDDRGIESLKISKVS